MNQLMELWKQFSDLTFWENVLNSFRSIGPLAPVGLAALESVIPPIPLVGIVALNIVAYGTFLGALYSWIGTCIGCTLMFFFWRCIFQRLVSRQEKRHEWIQKGKKWVENINGAALFLIAMMPFTPSFFLNFAFGVSNYPAKRYFSVLYFAKMIMISLLALLGESAKKAFSNPFFIILVIILFLILYYGSKYISRKYDRK